MTTRVGICAKPAAIAIHPQPLLTAGESEFDPSRLPTTIQSKRPHPGLLLWTRPCAGIETAGRGALAGFRREQSGLNLRYGADTEHTTAVKTAFTIEREAFEQFNLEAELPPTTRAPAALKEKMLPRLLGGLVFHLDANLINARQKQDPVNRMERWRDEGVILLAMAGIAHEEA